HEELIEAIRSTGAQNVIVLDGHNYGQEGGYVNGVSDSAILSNGEALNEKYDNLVYSLHMYGEWMNGQSRLEQYLDTAKAKGLAVIIGEYGADELAANKSATQAMFNATLPRNVGRIAWAWADGDTFELTDGNGGFGITPVDGSKPTNLTAFGHLVWDDNHGTLTAPVEIAIPMLSNGNFE